MPSPLRFSLVFAFMASAPLFAGLLGPFGPSPETEVNVNVDLTAEGKKITPPSPGHPVFYRPLMGGYTEKGALIAGEKKPPTLPIAKLLAKALAAQGYFVMGPDTPPPSLLLVFHWGYMNLDAETGTVFNEAEALALVGGKAVLDHGINLNHSEMAEIKQAARDDRYFVVVTAYDFAAAMEKKKKLLWRAKMSTPSNGVNLEEVLPAMIASGGPHFGRETIRPAWTSAPIAREGKVEVGAPVVAPEPAQKPSPAAEKKPE